MGVTYRTLAASRLDSFRGSGVFYGSVSSEARSLRNMEVFIVGGGNSAGQAAIHLAKFARQVTLVTRGDGLSDTMSRYLVSFLENADRDLDAAAHRRSSTATATRGCAAHAGAGGQRRP